MSLFQEPLSIPSIHPSIHPSIELQSYSRGYSLDPPPLPPNLAALKRLILTPISFGALSVALIAIALPELGPAGSHLLLCLHGLLLKLPFAPSAPSPPPSAAADDGWFRRVLLACALLGCACAWLLGPRADRFGQEAAAQADLHRLQSELRQAEAAQASVQAEVRRLEARRGRRHPDALVLAESRLLSAVGDVSEKEAALAAARVHLTSRGDELKRDVGEAVGRVASCPTCARRQCFDCGLDWDRCGHRHKTCEQVAAEAEDPAARKKAEEKKRKEVARLQEQEQLAARKAGDEAETEKELQRLYKLPHDDARGWKPCPSCNAPINKIEACLHMNCANCGVKFCWRCGDYRPRGTAYPCGSGSCCNGVRQWWTNRRRPRTDGGAASALTRRQFKLSRSRQHMLQYLGNARSRCTECTSKRSFGVSAPELSCC